MTVFDRNIKVSMARGGQGAGGGSSAGAVVGGGGAPRGGSDPDRVTRTIHVGGIPMDVVSEEQLADYFKHVGEVRQTLFLSAISPAAFVEPRCAQHFPSL